jgi:hypothetical protein
MRQHKEKNGSKNHESSDIGNRGKERKKKSKVSEKNKMKVERDTGRTKR